METNPEWNIAITAKADEQSEGLYKTHGIHCPRLGVETPHGAAARGATQREIQAGEKNPVAKDTLIQIGTVAMAGVPLG